MGSIQRTFCGFHSLVLVFAFLSILAVRFCLCKKFVLHVKVCMRVCKVECLIVWCVCVLISTFFSLHPLALFSKKRGVFHHARREGGCTTSFVHSVYQSLVNLINNWHKVLSGKICGSFVWSVCLCVVLFILCVCV